MTCDLEWLGEAAVWFCVAYTVCDLARCGWRWVRAMARND